MQGLTEQDWDILLRRIADSKCTPVVGRGACSPEPPVGCDPARWNFQYPLGPDMCRAWALQVGYPFADSCALDRVAQFVAIQRDPSAPKEHLQKIFSGAEPPDFTLANEPHRVLAALPVPVYLTTNFDDFLTRALRQRPERDKDPKVQLCRWHKNLPDDLGIYLGETEKPTVANPLVYHFLGRSDHPDSLVLTEDDQYEFLINLARDEQTLINHWVQRALSSTTILFLGYTLQDRDFLVLFRLLSHFLRESQRIHVAVQLAPDAATSGDPEKAVDYLNSYFDNFRIRVFWGDCKKFTAELWSRWQARSASPPGP
jgi:hypothetical protein